MTATAIFIYAASFKLVTSHVLRENWQVNQTSLDLFSLNLVETANGKKVIFKESFQAKSYFLQHSFLLKWFHTTKSIMNWKVLIDRLTFLSSCELATSIYIIHLCRLLSMTSSVFETFAYLVTREFQPEKPKHRPSFCIVCSISYSIYVRKYCIYIFLYNNWFHEVTTNWQNLCT